MDRFNKKHTPHNKINLDLDLLHKDYIDGISIKDLCIKYKVSSIVIFRHLKLLEDWKSIQRPKGADKKILGARRTRAGKRRCKRCKEVWNRLKDDISTICNKCKTRCSRCDIELSVDNVYARNKYQCKKCCCEQVANTKGNAGFKQREYDLLRTYGITVNEYEAMLSLQGGVCWICSKPPTTRRLSVDHKHLKGENGRNPREKRPRVRGLLCWKCNTAIGKFNDNPDFLRKAAEYLEKCPAKEVIK